MAKGDSGMAVVDFSSAGDSAQASVRSGGQIRYIPYDPCDTSTIATVGSIVPATAFGRCPFSRACGLCRIGHFWAAYFQGEKGSVRQLASDDGGLSTDVGGRPRQQPRSLFEVEFMSKSYRIVTRGSDGSIRIRDYDKKESLLRLHSQIGIDDSSTDLSLRGLPVFRGLIGPIPDGKGIVRYESPEVFETLTKDWASTKPARRSRRKRPSDVQGPSENSGTS